MSVCVCWIGFFTGEDDSAISKFKAHASSMRDDFRFGYSTDAGVLEEYGYSECVG